MVSFSLSMKDILDKYYILIIILRIEWTDALVDATGSLSSWYIIIVCRCTDRSMFFIFHHRRCGSSHVPLHSSSFAVFSSQTHLFLFFSFYIIDVLDQQAGISFSRLSREDTRLDLLLYFIIIFFIIISIIDITIRFIIIDYIIIEFVLYHSARMRTKERKKKRERRKAISKRTLPAMETFRSAFSYHVITPSVLSVTSWFGKKENGKK